MISARYAKYFAALALLLVVVIAVGVGLLRQSGSPAADVRQIILISIDTCRADYLSCYGYESKTTPNIDALAAEGILFENVIAPAPETLPSHSSMLTGTIPPYHGVHGNFDYLPDASNITLAEILKGAGFATGAAISAIPLNSRFGLDQGFHTYNDHFENPVDAEKPEKRPGGETTDVALEWLEKNKDKRFFFFLHYYDPHAYYQPPEPFASRFASSPYAGEIAYTDHCIGRVVDKLKELGLYDSTLIIITADHGEMLGEHGEPTHVYFIYQSAIKVPLIFKLPGQNKPARIKSIAGLVDIVPTVCSLLDIETPKNVQGVDLFAGSQAENSSAEDRHIYCESLTATKYKANSLLGIVNDRFKYIQTTRPELYDLIQDPGESNNLVEKQHQRATIMKAELAQILEESVRKDSPDSHVAMDPETIAQLQSLGYVGGTVTEDFSFDQTKDDPKDLLGYHVLKIRTWARFKSKQYDKAQMLAEKMIQQRPDAPQGYEQMGLAALGQQDFSKAIVYFGKVIEIEPDNSQAYNNRGRAYSAQGDLEQAIRDFSKAIELDSKDASFYHYRGIAYSLQGDFEQGIRDFDEAIELDSKDANFYYYRGIAYSVQGDLEQAIRDFDEAIELNSKNAQLYIGRGRAYSVQGDLEQAIRDFSKAIELDSKDAEFYHYRGFAYSAQGDYERAVRDFKRAIKLNPDSAGACKNLAWILATCPESRIRDGVEAVRLAERACQLTGYKVPVTLDSLAAAYAEVGQFDQAVKTAETAVRMAQKARKTEVAKEIRTRLDLYRAKRPWRESFDSKALGRPASRE